MKTKITRRTLLCGLAATVVGRASSEQIGLGFGTYGTKTLPWDIALKTIADIGYDGVELALMPEWPTEPKLLTASDRRRMRQMLGDLNLALPSFLEVLRVAHPKQSHAENLDRLKRAIDLGHDLSPDNLPVVETILGRKTREWEEVKQRMVDEVGEWVEVAEAGNTTLCFKPHAGHAIHDPERSLWLIREIGSPSLRVVFDYSHLSLEGFTLAESFEALLPVTPFIHVKDSSGTPGDHRYLLPGDGNVDYVEYFGLLKKHGYQGFVVVEVSAQIHRKPEYQPVATAKICYERLSKAFRKAGVERVTGS